MVEVTQTFLQCGGLNYITMILYLAYGTQDVMQVRTSLLESMSPLNQYNITMEIKNSHNICSNHIGKSKNGSLIPRPFPPSSFRLLTVG